jgi:peptide deformylase
MRLKLITVPDNRLRQKSLPIARITQADKQLIHNLVDTLLKTNNPPGVGLSAVQVGEHKRVFVTYLPPVFDLNHTDKKTPPSEIKIFVNPEIISHSKEQTLGEDEEHPALEGCLSVPALYGPVPRYTQVTVKYQTIKGEFEKEKLTSLVEKTDTFSNFFARVIQHEYDHLEGILFTDYIKKNEAELYFDSGSNLVNIPDPNQLIAW